MADDINKLVDVYTPNIENNAQGIKIFFFHQFVMFLVRGLLYQNKFVWGVVDQKKLRIIVLN